MRRLVIVLLAGSALVTGCGNSQSPQDELQVSDTVTAAQPASSPVPGVAPEGTVLPLDGQVTAVTVVDSARTAVVALADPPALRLYDLGQPTAEPRTVPLPGRVDQLSTDGATVLAPVRTANALLRVTLPAATVQTTKLDGGPVAASERAGRTVVALAASKSVAVLDGDKLIHTVGGLASADQALLLNGGKAAVLDRLHTAVYDLDAGTGKLGAGLRAGDGATNAVTDIYGRVLVTDTRAGELLVFRPDTMIMLQRYPVPGAPYGIAYDEKRNLVWVTLTERNQVVGYDVAGGEPVERHRYATVRQPNSVAVDPTSGAVLVASAAGGGVQVIKS
ncbi:lipoprotein [Kutzneria viridogrisea]|uniref:Lipoprotein n=2 Tax=Kutzneria TaxID=43356 RepID=W5WAU3_9PSEU|nr:hypothetical protein [Kutzneria albida]AHH97621.1 hypothetical protein KALB_4259 [Kutzneria albida DSM 43870]MBA8924792.1 DNA-binding beta-propeller fold protein YncE [Kutzneria viridogrisea]